MCTPSAKAKPQNNLKALISATTAKGGKSRYVPIFPELAQELCTHLGERSTGYLFETNRHMPYSSRRIQQIVKDVADRAKIKKSRYDNDPTRRRVEVFNIWTSKTEK